MSSKPNVLYLDIETSPNKVYTWGLWNQNITIEKIVEPGRVLCWAAKWEGPLEGMHWAGVKYQGRSAMLKSIHWMLDQADMVVHYNGLSFDIPTLNGEFVQEGILPPSPYKQIDLCKVVQKQFRLPSSKLDYVGPALGLGEKVKHPGFQMWLDCMAGDDAAWAIMEKYNKQDVTLLEALYKKLQPWIPYHPTRVMDREGCPACGTYNVNRRGSYLAFTRRYQRFNCNECGAWFRGVKALDQRANVSSLRA